MNLDKLLDNLPEYNPEQGLIDDVLTLPDNEAAEELINLAFAGEINFKSCNKALNKVKKRQEAEMKALKDLKQRVKQLERQIKVKTMLDGIIHGYNKASQPNHSSDKQLSTMPA
ncbi:hypothetical protein PsalMR5_00780 [Piscirickettsia salmonis]|uniref:hypothetical protein n=1 Tax=Piscirickettsia salmonis TaxID=1238 RepID=UPI0012BAA2C8|nr:hypothetical protein [Piscirickettsia salmonis]QGP53372.1 hypothetical protein PsalSR1_00782 [Piscirickettsia salmonis]QGP60707.1 hypothetical protein PsalBI1_03326 [Piscirickettsia salmonis]QGP62937.1 hypothetical protein PsalMR5_00780 [Piscirickettsia salmonis]